MPVPSITNVKCTEATDYTVPHDKKNYNLFDNNKKKYNIFTMFEEADRGRYKSSCESFDLKAKQVTALKV